jgi:hypothetical protein
MGCGEEHHVAAGKGLGARLAKRKVYRAAQTGKHLRHRRAGLLARGDRSQLGLGVAGEQPEELDPRVPGTAYDADLDHGTSKRKSRLSAAFVTVKL